jgi:hypothetical protein
VRDDQGEHGVDHGWLDHWAKGLIIVDVRLLGEAVKNPTSLVPVLGAVVIKLVHENPLAGDDIGANRTKNKIPGVVGDQGNKLFFHCVTPLRIGEGNTDGGGH